MPDITQRIAELLLEHTARHDNNGVDLWLWCGCGDGVRYYDRRKHGAHVVEQLLSLPGIAIVEVPAGQLWDAIDLLIDLAGPRAFAAAEEQTR